MPAETEKAAIIGPLEALPQRFYSATIFRTQVPRLTRM